MPRRAAPIPKTISEGTFVTKNHGFSIGCPTVRLTEERK
jgi:hypothetical protein